jgi:hypothetical protein
MFQIKYSFSDTYKLTKIDYKIVDDLTIRYNLFLGNVFLQKNSKKIDLNWEWIPLLDFAICLKSICLTFANKKILIKEFEFTESDDVLIFEKKINEIIITTSYSNEKLIINYKQFLLEVKRFYSNLTDTIEIEFNEIKFNENYMKIKKSGNTLNEDNVSNADI